MAELSLSAAYGLALNRKRQLQKGDTVLLLSIVLSRASRLKTRRRSEQCQGPQA